MRPKESFWAHETRLGNFEIGKFIKLGKISLRRSSDCCYLMLVLFCYTFRFFKSEETGEWNDGTGKILPRHVLVRKLNDCPPPFPRFTARFLSHSSIPSFPSDIGRFFFSSQYWSKLIQPSYCFPCANFT